MAGLAGYVRLRTTLPQFGWREYPGLSLEKPAGLHRRRRPVGFSSPNFLAEKRWDGGITLPPMSPSHEIPRSKVSNRIGTQEPIRAGAGPGLRGRASCLW